MERLCPFLPLGPLDWDGIATPFLRNGMSLPILRRSLSQMVGNWTANLQDLGVAEALLMG